MFHSPFCFIRFTTRVKPYALKLWEFEFIDSGVSFLGVDDVAIKAEEVDHVRHHVQ